MHNVTTNLLKVQEMFDYSVEEMAELVEVHRSTMYRYVSGEREIPLHQCILLCEKLGLSLDWLIGKSDVMYLYRKENVLLSIYENLSTDRQKQLYDFAVYLQNQEKGETYER